jgi:hypothetical protein
MMERKRLRVGVQSRCCRVFFPSIFFCLVCFRVVQQPGDVLNQELLRRLATIQTADQPIVTLSRQRVHGPDSSRSSYRSAYQLWGDCDAPQLRMGLVCAMPGGGAPHRTGGTLGGGGTDRIGVLGLTWDWSDWEGGFCRPGRCWVALDGAPVLVAQY